MKKAKKEPMPTAVRTSKKLLLKRRKKLKLMVIEYEGGKCIICHYKNCPGAFDLHHVNGVTKEFGLSMQGLTHSWERSKKEADKCVLLCANATEKYMGEW